MAHAAIAEPIWIVVRTDGRDRMLLDTLFWPDRIAFTSHGLKALGAHRYKIERGHLDILLDNGRAIYRIEERDRLHDRYAGMCVYSETW